jgi:predicted aspartyl protease
MIRAALSILLAASGDAAAPPVTHFETGPAQPAQAEGGTATQLAVKDDLDQRMTVPVRLGGSRPFRFLVDTGADRTSVSVETARELGLVERPQATLHSATGQSLVRMAHLPEIHMSRRSVRNINAPLLAAADIGADGILGMDSLRSQKVVFDFAKDTLTILSAKTPTALEPGTIVVRARRREGRLVITNALLDGEKVGVVLDTGAALSIGNAALRAKLAKKGVLTVVGPITLLSVTGEPLIGELALVDRLNIGGVRLERLHIVFAEAHTFGQLKLDRKPAMLLGMNALRGFEQVAINFADRRLSLVPPKKRQPAPPAAGRL